MKHPITLELGIVTNAKHPGLLEEISNAIIVKEEGKNYAYQGRACSLHSSRLFPRVVFGQAILAKYERTERLLWKTRYSLFPFKMLSCPTKKITDEQVWSFSSGPSAVFIHDSTPVIGNDRYYEYRGGIRLHAKEKGTGISPQLFEEVFGPIDDVLLRIYEGKPVVWNGLYLMDNLRILRT
ncbi:MAG: hypothetical protein V1725_03375 [archaeon]